MRSTPDEVERLERVYSDYELRDLPRTRWGESNRGNLAIVDERRAVMRELMAAQGLASLRGLDVLEVGCGTGGVLASLLELGADAKRLRGIDLLPDRIKRARRAHPRIDFRTGNAEELPYEDASFDLLVMFVVFSSILDGEMRRNVARECVRVLRPGGHVLWYDFRYDNPSNPHVRGMRRKELVGLFPGFTFSMRTLTVVPQLARRLGPATGLLYPILASVPPLRTYILGLLRRPS